MADNCCIITKKEFDELKSKALRAEQFSDLYTNCLEEVTALRDEVKKLKSRSSIGINVVGRIDEYKYFKNAYGSVYTGDKKLSEENVFEYVLELDRSSIIPQGKIRRVMMNTFDKLKDYMITHTKEYVDKHYEKRVEDIKNAFDEKALVLEREIKRLKKIIDDHNNKCFFKSNKLKY